MRKLSVAAAALALLGLPGTAFAQPANDDFDTATVVSEPLPFSDSISTVDATTAADDPQCSGDSHTVWYLYTPSAGGFVTANTFGSDYDTTLSVYTGGRGYLTLIACNDDAERTCSRASSGRLPPTRRITSWLARAAARRAETSP